MSTQRVIDFNADAGESFGRWKLGDDDELFKIVTTVNIACGYHAGDPANMRKAVAGAKRENCVVGAHPGYPDLLGFGRRAIPVTDSDLLDYILYQVGALQAIAASEGVKLAHVKLHGSMSGAVYYTPHRALAIVEALQSVEPGIALMVAPGPSHDALVAAGHPVIAENAADLDFDDDGKIILEPVPGPKPPEGVADQASRLATGQVMTVGGKLLPMKVDTIAVHGDRPNAVELARAVRARLESEGYVIKALTEVEAR